MKMTLTRAAIATSTFVCAALFSISWTEQGSLSLSVSKADARARVYITSGLCREGGLFRANRLALPGTP